MPLQSLRSLTCLVLLASLHIPAAPAAHTQHPVAIEQCWIRALPGNLPAAGYFRLVNHSAQVLTLTGAHTEAYAHTMLHATEVSQGMHRMVHTHAVQIPANGHTDFSPGGYHLMLEAAVQPVHAGGSITVVFSFDRVGNTAAKCTVRPADTAPETPLHHSHSHHH